MQSYLAFIGDICTQSALFVIMSPFLEQLNVHSNISEQLCTSAVLCVLASMRCKLLQELTD